MHTKQELIDIKKTMKDAHAEKRTWKDIATILNERGFKTKTGKFWTGAAASQFGLMENAVPRRMRPFKKEQSAKEKVTIQVKTNAFSMDDVVAIAKSDMSTDLKTKILQSVIKTGSAFDA